MADSKTKATKASVERFIESLPQHRRSDVTALVKLMQSVSHQEPRMWGPSIIGFGSYRYQYNSGRKGEMPLVCFSPRKSANVVYNMGSAERSLLEKLGKHALSGGCLHIAKLSDVDPKILKALIAQSFAKARAQSDK